MSKECACVLVICPLRSLIEDQIKKAKSLGFTANSLPESSLADVRVGKFQSLFSSAENALDKEFLQILKKKSKFQSPLKRAMTNAAIIRSHIISPACFFCLGKKSAIVVFRALFALRGLLVKNGLPEVNDN